MLPDPPKTGIAAAGSRPDAHVATAGATDATSARERETGERRATEAGTAWSRSYGRHLPDRGQAATSRRQGHGHKAREHGTGERRDARAGMAAGPQGGYAPVASTCRIAAKRLSGSLVLLPFPIEFQPGFCLFRRVRFWVGDHENLAVIATDGNT